MYLPNKLHRGLNSIKSLFKPGTFRKRDLNSQIVNEIVRSAYFALKIFMARKRFLIKEKNCLRLGDNDCFGSSILRSEPNNRLK